jgi:hypothetical protein
VRFELDADQRAVLDAVEGILESNAGPARARQLGGDQPRHDAELAELLRARASSDWRAKRARARSMPGSSSRRLPATPG